MCSWKRWRTNGFSSYQGLEANTGSTLSHTIYQWTTASGSVSLDSLCSYYCNSSENSFDDNLMWHLSPIGLSEIKQFAWIWKLSETHLARPGRLPMGSTASGLSLWQKNTQCWHDLRRCNPLTITLKTDPNSSNSLRIKLITFSNLADYRSTDIVKKRETLRDKDGIDEVIRSQVWGTGLPVSERGVEVPAVEDRFCWLLHCPANRKCGWTA